MPVRAAVFRLLPAEGLQWLRDRLIANHCTDFGGLSEEIEQRYGVRISKSAIHRYSLTLPDSVRLLVRETDGKPLYEIQQERRQQQAARRRHNPPTNHRRGQRERIKADLLAGRRISRQTALAEHGCYNLPALIQRIRRVDGWPVESVRSPGCPTRYQLPDDVTPKKD